MAESQGVWGIDIGQAGLKAIRLKYADAADQVLAVAFDYVPHPKILSQPDAIPDELIGQALDKFLSRNEVKGDRIAISVPGQTALTRFIQLPPVESSKIAEIVKYEARQQIPFALEDVCWQWQTLGGGVEESGYMLEAEVGLFAMKRDQVMQHLKPFTDRQIEVDLIQIAPLALYNYLIYDQLGIRPKDTGIAQDEHTILLDMGADNTTLMVSNGEKIWIRNVNIGGNHFTRALTKEMKLTFAKAEHLKINATKSPDPRAVFQALRPVFNDFVSEIQRSIGYFSSVNRNAKIGRVLGLGNGFKLAGLQKFLQQNLQFEVKRVDSFQALVGDTVLNSKLFDENILSFCVPYGLALQALNLTRIHVDLLPNEIRTTRLIRRKKPWAVATAACLLCTFALSVNVSARNLKSVGTPRWGVAESEAKEVNGKVVKADQDYKAATESFDEQSKKDGQLVRPVDGKRLWAVLYKALSACLPFDVKVVAENDITQKNRIKIISCLARKVPDLKTWHEGIPDSQKQFMRSEDQKNAPSGEGYVITLKLAHYRKLPSGKEINWIRRTLIENLKKWEILQQWVNQKTGQSESISVPVRSMGITHPVIILGSNPEPFSYNRNGRRSVAASSRAGTGDGDTAPMETDPMMGDGTPPGMGEEEGMPEASRFAPRRKAAADDKKTMQVMLTQVTVQFVWQPLPPQELIVFNKLYQFFSKNEEGSFEKAQDYMKKALENHKDIQFTQKHYKDFVRLHHDVALAKSIVFKRLYEFFAENKNRSFGKAQTFMQKELENHPEIPFTQELYDEFVKKYHDDSKPKKR
ncbi:MAG: type IV pilus assembly protein PilM [Planctomycetes bacterium]|nr:type IV pilus assembly protein PilM [Planctomycetota bacterium]